ncbi:exported protein of unknown function [Candidatus Nitrosocosmicus franklandus]|uniref:Uncharacterized protein n=1 Tax=Candidatus Nitrosocosmicus franklandianus TaxID=1798806 RepID=A0A484IBP2_9ARCH|nr:exported protein of unknown function [Candidatus Nitrosocosmicus franklandus]
MNTRLFFKFSLMSSLLTFVFFVPGHIEPSFAQLHGMLGGHVVNIENYQFQNTIGCSVTMQLTDSPPSMVVLLSSDSNLCNTFLTSFQNNYLVVSEVSFLLSPPPSPSGNWNVPVFTVFSATIYE